MHFNDGKFKILVLADIHTPDVMPKWTRAFIEKVKQEEKPDLIVLLGDNTAGAFSGFTEEKTKKAVGEVLSCLGDTPFTVVFGNHDHEGLSSYSETQAKKALLGLYTKKDTCLAVCSEEMTGVGNYCVNIKDSKNKEDVFSLYFIDSGTYKDGGYAYVEKDQIEWFERERNGEKKTPCIVFQHIIVPEIYDCLIKSESKKQGYVKGQCSYKNAYYALNKECTVYGSVKEGPCPPNKNGGEFHSWLSDGKVLAGVFGHDHINDFDVVHKGIRLLACPSPSFFTYGNNRGVRVITLSEDDLSSFSSKVIHYSDYTAEKPLNPFVNRYGIQLYKKKVLPILFSAVGIIGASALAGILIKKAVKK